MADAQPAVPIPQINITEVGQLGNNILGFIDLQRIEIFTNEWVNLVDLCGFTSTEVATWIATVERRTVSRDGT